MKKAGGNPRIQRTWKAFRGPPDKKKAEQACSAFVVSLMILRS